MQLTITVNPRDVLEVRHAIALLEGQLPVEGKTVAAPTAEKPKAEKPKVEKAAEQKPEQPPAAAAEPPAAIDYAKDVQPLILKMVAKDRDEAVRILGTFGVPNGKQLKPEQYADVVKKFTAALEA